MTTTRPVLFVLAGVNGAGKSSIGGALLQERGLAWFNPDAFARELMAATGCDQRTANIAAWQEGMRRLDAAVTTGTHYALETTLGGRTVPARLLAATQTHDVLIWYCGLSAADQHIARVRARVAAGGHDIPEDLIRRRWTTSRGNLIALMPHVHEIQLYDNSQDVRAGAAIPDPALLAHIVDGRLRQPQQAEALRSTPEWAKPVIEAALAGESGVGPA